MFGLGSLDSDEGDWRCGHLRETLAAAERQAQPITLLMSSSTVYYAPAFIFSLELV